MSISLEFVIPDELLTVIQRHLMQSSTRKTL